MKKRFLKITAILLLLAGIFYSCVAEKTDDNTQNEECEEVHKCECGFDDDLDLSELNEENCGSRWAVELTLKYGITDSPTENSEIKALVAEHNVIFGESFPGATSPVLMRYYTLEGKDCDMHRARAAVRAFLATSMFEHVRVFGIYSIAN